MTTEATPDRTEGLLALILVSLNKDRSTKDKAGLLSLAGFSNVEIADLLNTSSAVIAQVLYESRREHRSKKRIKKAR
jgi:hypothetical protein